MPASLELLDCKSCNALQRLPLMAHTCLSTVDCSNCPLVHELPGLPATVVSLFAIDLPHLQALPQLPTTLRCLYSHGTGKQCCHAGVQAPTVMKSGSMLISMLGRGTHYLHVLLLCGSCEHIMQLVYRCAPSPHEHLAN